MIEVKTEEFNGHKIATVFHDGGNKRIVIFCHGYRGTSIGPSRFFVRAADKLASEGISSLRFDQFGSGNSEGDFFYSSFNDWLSTTKEIAKESTGKPLLAGREYQFRLQINSQTVGEGRPDISEFAYKYDVLNSINE